MSACQTDHLVATFYKCLYGRSADRSGRTDDQYAARAARGAVGISR